MSGPQGGSGDPVRVIPDGLRRPNPNRFPRLRIGPALALVAGAMVVLFLIGSNQGTPIVWETFEPPPGVVNLGSLTVTVDGFSVLSQPGEQGVVLWSSTNGNDWSPDPLPGAPFRVVVSGDRLIGFRGSSAALLNRTSDGWAESAVFDLPEAVRIGYGSGRSGIVANTENFLAQTMSGDVYRSEDGSNFELVVEEPAWGVEIGLPIRSVCQPPRVVSLDVPPIVATPEGFLALVSVQALETFGVWPVCEPEVWFSRDGSDWAPIAGEHPFGPGAYVYDFAWRADRLVAVGGVSPKETAVWVSDDAVNWERLPLFTADERFELRSVDAGDLGWVILGELADRPGLLGWVSRDGECWERLPREVQGRMAVVGTDRILLADRIGFLDTWLGVVEGGVMEVRCR